MHSHIPFLFVKDRDWGLKDESDDQNNQEKKYKTDEYRGVGVK